MVGAADNVTDGYRAVQPGLDKCPGGDVLVVGGLAQSCGLYAAMAARALTTGRVLYVDESPERLLLARGFGVDTLPLPITEDAELGQFPVTVEASASQLGLTLAIRATSPNGICTCLAGGVEPIHQIPRMEMFGQGITLDISRANVSPLLDRVVHEVTSGRLQPASIALPTLGFKAAAEAMSDLPRSSSFGATSKLQRAPASISACSAAMCASVEPLGEDSTKRVPLGTAASDSATKSTDCPVHLRAAHHGRAQSPVQCCPANGTGCATATSTREERWWKGERFDPHCKPCTA